MSETTLILAGIFAAVITIAFVWFVLRKKRPLLDSSISSTEQMFARVLEKAVGGQYVVYSKIPLSAVLEPMDDLSNRAKRRAISRIKPYQFDYLVCARDTAAVVCAVELDDHQFSAKQFKKTVLKLEAICESVSLPLLRVAPQKGYNLVEIIERFERTIAPLSPAEAPVYTANTHLKIKPVFKGLSD